MRALPYALLVLGAALIMAGFAQMPFGTPPTAWALGLIAVGFVLAVAGCVLYWHRHERRPLAPVWDGPPRTIVPPARPRR